MLSVEFRTNKLKKCFLDYKHATRVFGEQVARKYIQRINIIKATHSLDDLIAQPLLKCHPLKGNRKGQYAIQLTGFYRLIFTINGETLSLVTIEEVSKHYDD